MADTFEKRLSSLLAGLLPDDTVAPGFFKGLLKKIAPTTTEAELARRNAILQGGRLGPSTDVFEDLTRVKPGLGSRLAPDLTTAPTPPPRRELDIGIIEARDDERLKSLQESTVRASDRIQKAEAGLERTLLRGGTLPEDLPARSEPFQPPVLFPGSTQVEDFLKNVDEEEDDEDEL